jgi:hypothetical protein
MEASDRDRLRRWIIATAGASGVVLMLAATLVDPLLEALYTGERFGPLDFSG